MIDAASVWSGLQTFGFALSGGLDMDNNGYPGKECPYPYLKQRRGITKKRQPLFGPM